MWAGTIVLCVSGVMAAAYRAAHITDAARRAEPLRERILLASGQVDPLVAERRAELRRMDSRFGDHPWLTLGHVIPGAVFLAFAPFQFWGGLRSRYRGLHRWSGRVLLCTILVSTAPALYFGLRVPFGGGREALVIAIVTTLLLASVAKALIAIRRGQVAQHREWMLRAFALVLGVATIRIASLGLDLLLAPWGIGPATVFVVALIAGWALTAGVAEWGIVHTRARPFARS